MCVLSLRGLCVAVVALACAAPASAGDTYVLDSTFSLELPKGVTKLASAPGIAFNSKGQMIVSHRGLRPILVYGTDGKLLDTFGDDELTAVHGTRVDSEDNIWVTDHKNHTVIKYAPTGDVLKILGRRDMPGEDDVHFNRPTDVAFGKNGDFFVSDGYGNNRVVKFTKDYQYVKAWGTKGTKPGEFNLPHCILTDAKGLLHVSDRENDRVQVFDQDGNYVRNYGGFAPFGLFLTPDQTLFVADGRAHKCLRMSLDGKVDAQWGSEGAEPGQFNLPHGIAVDSKGNVYVGEIEGRRVQKFVRR